MVHSLSQLGIAIAVVLNVVEVLMAYNSREWPREMRWYGHLGIIEKVIIWEEDHITHVFDIVYSDHIYWLTNGAKTVSTQFPVYLEKVIFVVFSACVLCKQRLYPRPFFSSVQCEMKGKRGRGGGKKRVL